MLGLRLHLLNGLDERKGQPPRPIPFDIVKRDF